MKTCTKCNEPNKKFIFNQTVCTDCQKEIFRNAVTKGFGLRKARQYRDVTDRDFQISCEQIVKDLTPMEVV